MAGEFKIGAGLSINGEKEFKAAVANINRELSVLGSEMKKVSAQFEDNASSMDALRAKQDVLARQYDAQRSKVETLRAALESAKKEYGENSAQVASWQIKLNNAEAELHKMQRALEQNKAALDRLNPEPLANSFKRFGEAVSSGVNSPVTKAKEVLTAITHPLNTVKDGFEGFKQKISSGLQEKITTLTDKLNGVDDALDTAGKKAKQSGDEAEKGASGWAKLDQGLAAAGKAATAAAAAAATAAAAAVAAIGKMTLDAAKGADEINTLAKQTGLSTETLQKFKFASEQIDVSMDTLTGSLAKLTRNMASAKDGTGPAAEAFKALGVSVTDGSGHLRDSEDVFNDAINALGKVNNEAERDALAMQIFGRSAQELNPLILGGADALKKLGDEAEAAGLILSQQGLDNLNSLQDALDTFKSTASGAGSLFATAFAGPMAEGLNTLTGYMRELAAAFNQGGFEGLADKLGEVLSDLINKIGEHLPKLVELGLTILNKLIEGITANLPALTQSAIEIIMMLVNSLVSQLPQLIQMGLQVIVQLALGIAQALPELIPTIVDTMLTIVNTLIDNIDMLIDAAIAIMIALAEGLINALPKLIEKAPVIIEKLVKAIVNNVPKLIEAAIQIVVTLAKGIVDNVPKLLNSAWEIIQTLAKGIVQYWSNLLDIGKRMVEGIWEGIKNAGKWLMDKIVGFFNDVVDGVKRFLGIKSPSRVFAGIGENMALGLGEGFVSAMSAVSRSILDSIPTSISMTGTYALAGASAGAGGGVVTQNIVVQVSADDLRSAADVVELFARLRQTARQGA